MSDDTDADINVDVDADADAELEKPETPINYLRLSKHPKKQNQVIAIFKESGTRHPMIKRNAEEDDGRERK